MKRIHLINLSNFGGAEKILIDFLDSKKNGDDLVINIGKSIDKKISKRLSEVKVINSERIFKSKKIKYPKFMRSHVLLHKIESLSPDTLIIWDYVAKFPRKPKSSKVIFYDHGCSWRFADNDKTRSFFNKVDGCISVSHASKRVLELRFNLTCPIKVIKNSIKNQSKANQKNESARKSTLIIGTASRLVPLKAVGVSILTINELVKNGINAKLYIAGQGPDEEMLKSLASSLELAPYIEFLGFQDNMSEFYESIDIYMSTPVTESFGLSCLDAIFHGIPVLFPLIDGQPEVVANNISGIGLVPELTQHEYELKTGIKIDFSHEVYDPLKNTLTEAKVLSEISCAREIEKLLVNDNLSLLKKSTIEYSKSNFDFENFIDTLEKGFNKW